MITSYDLGKIYEFSNDSQFINRAVGILVSYTKEDEKYPFEYYPLLEENSDLKYSSYCRAVPPCYQKYLFGEIHQH